jgi:adenylyl-sulfate kinase
MQNQHNPCVFWLTGLSGAGKSTIARALHERLVAHGHAACLLDGDILRGGLCSDLGFCHADRSEHIRRTAAVASLLVNAGISAIVALISPTRTDRDFARRILAATYFIEIFVDAPLPLCEARDVKGLYARARRGALHHFAGISSPYEPPLSPEVWLHTGATPVGECVDQILQRANHIQPPAFISSL